MNKTAVEFSEQARKTLEDILKRYPDKRSAMLPVLHLAQDEFKVLSDEVIEYLSDIMGFSPAYVKGVVTFYKLFNTKPVGRYHIQLCTNISCALLGSEDILTYLKEKLGLDVGEVSSDGKFSLTTVECLGSCGTAPVMQINDTYYENLTKDKVDEILGKLS